jgi:hypothetical protein
VLVANAENLWEDVAGHILRPSLPLNPKQTGIVLADAVLDAYAGRYVDASGAGWPVARGPSGLVLTHPQGYRVPLTPQSETHFTVQGFPNLSVDFQRDAAGKATGLAWTLSGAATLAVRAAD